MSKQCNYTRDDVWEYFSNMLTRKEEKEMQQHILTCDRCQSDLKQMRGTADFFSKEDIKEAATISSTPTKKKNTKTRIILIAASIAASIAIVVLFTDKTSIAIQDQLNAPPYSAGDTIDEKEGTKIDTIRPLIYEDENTNQE